MKSLNQTGDTIIEVLLAMTIVALILAGAYATSSRSLNTSQYSQERTRATRIAESQIEQIKSLEPVNNDPRLTSGAFCVDVSQANPVLDASVATNCVESFFKTSVTLSGNIYKVVVEWTPPGGNDSIEAKANVTLNYLYDVNDSPVVVPDPPVVVPDPPVVVPDPTSKPTVTTGSVSSTVYNNVIVSSNVINSDGGEAISQKGVAYFIDPNPTITDGFVSSPDTETSPFNVSITDLNPNTVYYFRAFATNSKGTAYGGQTSITTGPLTAGGYTAPLSGSLDGSDYYFIDYEASWVEARSVASAVGGHLVTVTSPTENSYVAGLTQRKDIWIGLNDIATEGTWVWDNGTPVSYTNWATREPNDYTPGEDAVVMWNSVESGTWNDWSTSGRAPFIIEFDGAPSRK